ncbi:probable pentatricopeptide repeat-containing protein At1g63330 at C-terminar half [Coccomyxa sp. Obi]|nr:probable pentatricopeptide repeat-containing protein At1g63330 at C-terminar half [Coccomyxa sp. Obi]
MLRGSCQGRLAQVTAAAADAATREGPWGLFPGLPRSEGATPWCTGTVMPHSASDQAVRARQEARKPPLMPPPDHRSAAVQSRRQFTCDVQAGVLSQAALPPPLSLLGSPFCLGSHTDLGRLQAQISSGAERGGGAASPEERAAVVERLRRRLAERGLTGPPGGSELAASAGVQLSGLHASMAWEVGTEMKAAMRRGDSAAAARLFDPSLLLQVNPIVAADVCDKLLEACARLAEADLAVQVAHSMRSLGIPVGYVAHGCVLRALCMAGNHEAALGYLAAEVPGSSHSTIMYNTILSSAQHHGKAGVAAKAMQMMVEKAVPRDAQTWVLIFRALGSARDAAALSAQWEQVNRDMRSSLSVRSAFVSALCACGQVREAAAALQELLDRYAGTYSSKGAPSGSKEASNRLQNAQQTVPVDPEERGAALTEGNEQQTSAGVGGGGLDHWKDADRAAAQACHQVIHAAERARDAALAHQTLLAMHKAGVRADTAIYNSILRLVAADGGGPDALEAVVAEMRLRGVRLDRRTYFLLLRGYSATGDLSGASDVMRRMAHDGIAPDRFTFNALLEAHAAVGNLEGASQIYDAMSQRRILPDICTFIALFQAVKAQGPLEAPGSAAAAPADTGQSLLYHMRGNARSNAADLLHNWLQDFQASGVRHTPQSLTSLVQALGHTCLIEPMLDLIREAWNAPDLPRPSIYASNAAIAACARVGRMQEALDLYRDMEREGLAADMHTYTSLIGGCAYTRQPALAYELFEEMRQHGIQPNVYTYNALIKAECHVGNLTQALHLVDVMEDDGVVPDVATWGTLMSAAKYLGQPELAEMVLERMSGRRQEQTAVQHASIDQDVSGKRVESAAFDDDQIGWDDDDDDMFGGPRF